MWHFADEIFQRMGLWMKLKVLTGLKETHSNDHDCQLIGLGGTQQILHQLYYFRSLATNNQHLFDNEACTIGLQKDHLPTKHNSCMIGLYHRYLHNEIFNANICTAVFGEIFCAAYFHAGKSICNESHLWPKSFSLYWINDIHYRRTTLHFAKRMGLFEWS